MPSEESLKRYARKYGNGAPAAARRWQASRRTINPKGEETTTYVPEREPHVVPDGMFAERISSFTDSEGNETARWTKYAKAANKIADLELLLEGMREKLEPAPWIAPPRGTNHDFCNILPIGDHHLGMLAWPKEVGEAWDVKIGENMLAAATDHLFARMIPATHCVIAFLGDFTHYDSTRPVTPTHGNILDADVRKGKLIPAVSRSMRRVIDQAAAIHDSVHVIVESGNHDPDATLWMQELLQVKYADNPRITIDGSPSVFHYHHWGNNLIGTNHGDKVKLEELPIIMASDAPKEWGETQHRMIFTGHIHHRRALDVRGVSVESMRVLPPGEAYAHQAGYRTIRQMQGITIHRETGEFARYSFSPAMLG